MYYNVLQRPTYHGDGLGSPVFGTVPVAPGVVATSPVVAASAGLPVMPAPVAAVPVTAPAEPYTPESWDPSTHWSTFEDPNAMTSDLMVADPVARRMAQMKRMQMLMAARQRQEKRIPWIPLILGGGLLYFIFGRK
jgi:hypothetical protein